MTTREEAALVLYRSFEQVISEMPRLAEMATQEERAAVVAWLRDEVDAAMKMCAPVRAATFLQCAEAIERGEHRREGEP